MLAFQYTLVYLTV